MESKVQPAALIDNSCRVRLDVKGMNCATKASKMGSPSTPSYFESASCTMLRLTSSRGRWTYARPLCVQLRLRIGVADFRG